MVAISVHADIKAATKGLNTFASKQVPFASAVAINDVAFQVQKAERGNIAHAFKSPRPFTQNSVQVDRATKPSPLATVFIRPEVAKYLDPYEFGGLHVTPGKALLNPKFISFDAFGQLRKGQVKSVAARKDVFVGRVHGRMGFWQRLTENASRQAGEGLHLLISFARNAPVGIHLRFEERGVALVRKQMPAAMKKALVQALASAR